MNRTTIVLLASFAITAFWGCDRTASATGTSDDTHSSVFVTGRVFTEQNQPLGAVVVHLRHAGLTDTTNGNGVFTLTGSIPASARSLSAVDTLDYLRDGITIYSASVATWVDTLPDLFLVQRNISGAITPGPVPVASTTATLWNAQGDSIPVPLEWNPVSQNYSGFAWFRYTGGLDSFQVRVKALDSIGRLLGESVKLAFTSRAGDILLPTFAAGNTLPVFVLSAPPSLVRGDTARIRASVTNPSGIALTYQWKIGSGPWTQGRTDTLIFVPPSTPGPNMTVNFRVSRADSLANLDSLRIPVVGNLPKVGISTSPGPVPAFRAFTLHLADTAGSGSSIVKRWIGAPWNVAVSGTDTLLTAPDTANMGDTVSLSVVYKVWDNLGDSASDSGLIEVIQGLPQGLTAIADSSSVRISWKAPRASSNLAWNIMVTDSALDTSGETFNSSQVLGKDAFFTGLHGNQLTISRQSIAKKLYLTFSTSDFTRTAVETTLVVDCPPLVWNFVAPFDFSDDIFGNGVPENYCASGTCTPDSQVFDTILQCNVDRLDYSIATSQPNQQPRRITQYWVTGWKDATGFTAKMRGTPGTLWVWMDLSFYQTTTLNSYQALQSKGITLGWEVSIDSTGGEKIFSIDSLRWSDGVQRTVPPLDSILTRSLGFSISLGGASPPANIGTQKGFLALGDVRFLR